MRWTGYNKYLYTRYIYEFVTIFQLPLEGEWLDLRIQEPTLDFYPQAMLIMRCIQEDLQSLKVFMYNYYNFYKYMLMVIDSVDKRCRRRDLSDATRS